MKYTVIFRICGFWFFAMHFFFVFSEPVYGIVGLLLVSACNLVIMFAFGVGVRCIVRDRIYSFCWSCP